MHRLKCLREAKVHMMKDEKSTDYHPPQHTGCLQGICPNNGFHTPFISIEKNHKQDDQRGEPEGYVKSRKDGILEDIYYQVETSRGTQHTGQDKKAGAGFIRAHSQSFIKVVIYGG